MTVAPQHVAEPSSLKDKLKAFGQKILDKLFPGPTLSPQQSASRHALQVRLGNAHRFAPQGRGVRREPVIAAAAVFVTAHPKFPKNLMLIRRGMDARVAAKVDASPERLAAIEAEFVNRYAAQAPLVARVA